MLYRWPQGRIIRTISMVVVALIACDLGWQGYQGQLSPWLEKGGWSHLIYAILLFGLALGALTAGAILAGFHAKSSQFLIDVEREMTKVVWPAKNEVIRSTIIITVMTTILALCVWLVDMLNYQLVFHGVFKWLGGGS